MNRTHVTCINKQSSSFLINYISHYNELNLSVYCTLKHVHHAEEGQGERGFAAACPATDPHLKTNKVSLITITNIQSLIYYIYLVLTPQFGYLLPRADVRVDIFEHRLQRGVVSDAQILDLDLSLSGPAIRNLRHS